MQGVKRKFTYVFFYEAISLVMLSTAFVIFSDKNMAHAGALGVITVVLAVVWNFLYNHVFECWESGQVKRGRNLARRVTHAVGFELGLVAMTLPLFAWWLDLRLLDALMLDAGLTLTFMVFTFVYNWCFDRIFGLPLAAQ
ncbi:PACE efflux transporter [Marinobacterium sediminicola]|uniref:Uncharacterized membrane protein n=1 Tax=Marinobacterium sediminicola TaxID=518898 RepID=A0ABY1RXE2_9GAMM|nr:PACE efflux transporter [Marinobacterium sediminicola]ULG67771.1 PACE efflux transporter [Marinobacterium sediminicola]SMR71577.1 Uncharacterized membrane protein [Marinobacterium sediminicola]